MKKAEGWENEDVPDKSDDGRPKAAGDRACARIKVSRSSIPT